MSSYTQRLETEHGHLNFYFNLIPTAAGDRYHVTVVDRDGKLHTFAMKCSDGEWEIINNDETPQWILKVRNKLSSAIGEFQSCS